MLDSLLKLKKTQIISKKQQSSITGGRIPTLYEFCCGFRPQSWWIAQYPFLATDPYYTCTDNTCG